MNHSFVVSLGVTIQNGYAHKSREAPTQMRLVAIEEPNVSYKFEIFGTQSSEFWHSHQLHIKLSYSGCRFEAELLGDGLT